MKAAIVLLLAVSLALNVALGVILLAGSPPPAPLPVRPAPVPTARPAAPPVIEAEAWQSLDAAAHSDLVARLRAAGFPPDVIRAILQTRFDEELAALSRQLDPDALRRPFWKSGTSNAQVQAALAKLRREQQKSLRALLGEETDSQQLVNQVMPGRRVDGLPAEKAAAVLAAIREFEDQRAELQADPLHPFNPERKAALDRAQRDAVARLLTPQEMEEYDLRNSATAMMMRMQLAAFAPTEDEFRAIFRLRQAFETQHGFSVPAGATAEQLRQRPEAVRRLTEQIRGVLGPTRGEEYALKSDFGYVQTDKIVERLELPRATTDQVYAVQRDVVARARALATDRSLPEESRTQQLTALREEAIRRLTPLLGGSRGVEVYREYGGPWLDALKPRPRSPPPGATPPRS